MRLSKYEQINAERLRQDLGLRSLLSLMSHLEAGGFGFKVRSTVEDGERIYYAQVYLELEKKFAPKFKGPTPTAALREAYINYLVLRARAARANIASRQASP